ncbi:hypothetical protein ABBQ38_001651 [Trebouxia sp. C0009 RCD-2024]
MFELPHFALELLVVLPCVQIMSSRLKILLMPPGRGVVPPFDQHSPEEAAHMSPVIMAGVWEDRKADHAFHGRLRANFRVLTLIVSILGLAAFNAMYVPLHLEQVIHSHPRSIALLAVAREADWVTNLNSTHAGGQALSPEMATGVESYMAKGCSSQDKLMGALAKHAQEVGRMRSPRYQDLTQCVEAALTIMRLSCEQYFTLISVFAAYLLFRQRLPPIARQVIWVNHRVSNIFKKAILYSFPAICWLYGAGLMFSSFASLVFWGQPAAHLYETLKTNFTIVHPVGLQDAIEAQIEQMNNNCAVCWSLMTVVKSTPSAVPPSSPEPSPRQNESTEEEEEEQPGPQDLQQGFMQLPFTVQATAAAVGAGAAAQEEDEMAMEQHACKALPCGHAFHEACIAKWLAQCYGQSRQPTCPMCNLVIKLQVTYQFSRRGSQAALAGQQGSTLGQQQHRRPNSPQPNIAGAAQAQIASASPGRYPPPSWDPVPTTSGHQQAERGHHSSSMAAAPSHRPSRPPSFHSWQHYNAAAADEAPHQEACSSRDLGAESAPVWPEVQRPAQPQASMRPSRHWGFAASGVDLQQHPGTSEHAQQGPAWAGHEQSSPARVGHANFTHEGDSIGRGGRQQQGRWAPAKLVHGMLTRARRNRHEIRPHPGSASAHATLADTTPASS